MRQPIPELTEREQNIRRAAHLYHCLPDDSSRVIEICHREGVTDDERHEGYQRYIQQRRDARQLFDAIRGADTEAPWET